MSKYLFLMQLEFKRFWLYMPKNIFNILTILLRLCLPYSVFWALYVNGKIPIEMINYLLWAVLIGQIINKSAGKTHTQIKYEIKSGEIITRLSEPMNYILAKMSQSSGHFLANFSFLGLIFMIPMAYFFPIQINVWLLLFFCVIGFFIILIGDIIIGLLSFLIEESDGVYWIYSKLYFLLGNQIIPVALLPAGVVNLAQVTPFYLGFSGPIDVATSRIQLWPSLCLGLLYIALYLGGALWMLSVVRKRFILNG